MVVGCMHPAVECLVSHNQTSHTLWLQDCGRMLIADFMGAAHTGAGDGEPASLGRLSTVRSMGNKFMA